ncbi:hypothetical protein [Acinetobacter gerneri]|uniref:hypothetical protein n=1 Tax=Acinetobacter gerneri TaxID=202952 RepID=UPI00321479BB
MSMDKCREAFEQIPYFADLLTKCKWDHESNAYVRNPDEFRRCSELCNAGLFAYQSRQAEVDQLKNLLEKDEYAHNLYYENANLQTLVEEKDKRINQALNFINNWWHPYLDQKLFVEALGRALRGDDHV